MTENSFRSKYERYIRSAPDAPDLRRKALTAVAAKMARWPTEWSIRISPIVNSSNRAYPVDRSLSR